MNQDEKLKEEVIKLFLENFLALALHPNHYGKTGILELKIELEPGAVSKRSKVRGCLSSDEHSRKFAKTKGCKNLYLDRWV